MKSWATTIGMSLLLFGVTARSVCAEDHSTEGVAKSQLAQGELRAFLGSGIFRLKQLETSARRIRGGRNIVSTLCGTILAFDGPRVRRSIDGGKSWKGPQAIGKSAIGCNAIVDELTGAILLINPVGFRLISTDDGRTWKQESIDVRPNLMNHGASKEGQLKAGAMQPGVTLKNGKYRGRLIMPVRWMPSNALPFRPYLYNTSIYSDDRGKTWQTTAPFPVFGSGEAALAELSDGRILYSSREHMSRGNRFFAWSYDGGSRWLNSWRSQTLPDGARGTSYGCMGGLVRLPLKDTDILIYSNLDTKKGVVPTSQRAGASKAQGRERISVWASFDGGKSWPAKRLVFGGPSAYSNLTVGRAGTASEGLIFLHFEGGMEGVHTGINVAVFNLAWLLDGKKTGNGDLPAWIHDRD